MDTIAAPPSLFLLPDAVQPTVEVTELGLEVPIAETLEQRGIYDATRLKARKPELYAVIAKLLSSQLISKQDIAKLCGVAWETVAAVEQDAAPTIRELKGRFAAGLGVTIAAGMDSLLSKARCGGLSALDIGILIDKWLLLAGEATARIEIREDPAVEAMRRFLDAVPMGRGDGENVAKGPGIGSVTGSVTGSVMEVGGSVVAPAIAPGSGPVVELEPAAVEVAEAGPSDGEARV